MKKRIYIAGKVTGLPENEVRAKFQNAAQILTDMGFIALNPIDLVNNPQAEWKTAMRTCIAALMTADAVYTLPCADTSPGAIFEMDICGVLQIPLFARYSDLQKRYGLYPPADCSHDNRKIKVIGGAINCETTVIACADCGTHLTEPETDCR